METFFYLVQKSKIRTIRFLLIVLGFIFFICGKINSQNLLPNPSFETAAWAQANSGSADWVSGPSNVFGIENARTGVKYMGESMGTPAISGSDFREYIKANLTSALIPGNTYECSIWVSLSENYGDYAQNKIGFATTNVNPFYAFSNAPIPLTPVYATNSIITQKVGWTQVSGTFIAGAADTWVIIGNFNSQASTTWSYVGPGASFYYGYYFMDDACLGPPGSCGVILPIEMLSFSGKADGRSIILDWKTATELNCHYFIVERSIDGISFESLDKVKGNGTSQVEHNYQYTDTKPNYGKINYYRLREVDFDGTSHYSQIISIAPKGVLNVYINMFPVPAQENITIEFNGDDEPATLNVYNSLGMLVIERNASGSEKIELNNLQAGTYHAVLQNQYQTIAKKFLVLGKQ